MRTTSLRSAFVIGTTLLSIPAHLAAQELPPAGDIIERYVDAIGGREAVLAAFTARSVGEFTLPEAGISGRLEMVTAAPNMLLLEVDIPGVGTVTTGFDGTTGWAMDPFMGDRVLTGDQLAELRDQTNPLFAVRDSSLFGSIETVEQTRMAGVACNRVRLVWKSGRETSDCYDVETGLLVATTGVGASPTVGGVVTTTMEEYEQFGEVRLATRITSNVTGMQQVITLSEVRFDGIEAAMFEPPAVIRRMIDANP